MLELTRTNCCSQASEVSSCGRADTYLEVVAAKHDTNNVFANVMDIPLHSGHNNDTCIVLRGVPTPQLLLFYVRQQMPDSLLHHPG